MNTLLYLVGPCQEKPCLRGGGGGGGMTLSRGLKLFSCSTHLSMNFIILINVRMPTINIY